MQDKSGIYTAMTTPFLADGKIDWQAFSGLLTMQKQAKVKGVVLCGTTGEGSSMGVQEKLALVRKAKAEIGSDLEIMVGVGLSSTDQTIELAKLCEEAGADSLLVVTPPYVKPNPSGLFGHFKKINDAVRVEICLYHIPGRTGQRVPEEQLAKICELDKITSVKESTSDLIYFSKAAELTKRKILSGDDLTFLASLAVGGQGVISVISNIFPKELVALQQAFFEGNHKEALRLHLALFPVMEALFVESNPCPVKTLQAHLGQAKEYLRSPLGPISEQSKSILLAAYTQTLRRLEVKA